MSSTTRVALIAVTGLSALSLAACGSLRASTGDTAAAASVTKPHTASSAPECAAASLKVSYTNNRQIRDGALAGMSHVDNVVMFVNKGSSTCWMRGYPGVAALNAAGRQIQQATRSTGTPDPLVMLKPGQTASALVTGNSASCTRLRAVHGLLVTAPDQRTSTRLGRYGDLCLASLGIQQVRRGNAGGLRL